MKKEVQWLEEPEVLSLLHRSRSSVRRLVAAGVIRTELQTPYGKVRPQTMYAAGDVERLKANPADLAEAAKGSSNLPAIRPSQRIPENIPAFLQSLPLPSLPTPVPALFLSIAEAAAYSGLTEGHIGRLIRTGVLRLAMERPRRIARAMLDAYARSFEKTTDPPF